MLSQLSGKKYVSRVYLDDRGRCASVSYHSDALTESAYFSSMWLLTGPFDSEGKDITSESIRWCIRRSPRCFGSRDKVAQDWSQDPPWS